MSTTTQAPPVPIRTGVRRYAILAALLFAILTGAVMALSLAGGGNAPVDSRGAVVDGTRGGSGCAHQTVVAGGVVEGTHLSDGCGAAGGSARHGGIQP